MHLSTIDHDSRPPSRASRRFKSRFTDNDAWLTNPVNSSPSPLSLESFTVDQLSSRLSSLNVAWFEFFSFFRRKKEQKKRDYRWLNVWLTRWERERERHRIVFWVAYRWIQITKGKFVEKYRVRSAGYDELLERKKLIDRLKNVIRMGEVVNNFPNNRSRSNL